jgi:PAS domain S-box-containing protein
MLKWEKEEISPSEGRFKRLFELSPIGITVLDIKGFITSCNPVVYELGGYSKEEMIGKTSKTI